uniref:ATP-dependent DNA helicase n=1 Tax=Panagrellus redivivus TaxID=6233 RepID=A0A7E4W375_PANRE
MAEVAAIPIEYDPDQMDVWSAKHLILGRFELGVVIVASKFEESDNVFRILSPKSLAAITSTERKMVSIDSGEPVQVAAKLSKTIPDASGFSTDFKTTVAFKNTRVRIMEDRRFSASGSKWRYLKSWLKPFAMSHENLTAKAFAKFSLRILVNLGDTHFDVIGIAPNVPTMLLAYPQDKITWIIDKVELIPNNALTEPVETDSEDNSDSEPAIAPDQNDDSVEGNVFDAEEEKPAAAISGFVGNARHVNVKYDRASDRPFRPTRNRSPAETQQMRDAVQRKIADLKLRATTRARSVVPIHKHPKNEENRKRSESHPPTKVQLAVQRRPHFVPTRNRSPRASQEMRQQIAERMLEYAARFQATRKK